jgi:hypothetical protein
MPHVSSRVLKTSWVVGSKLEPGRDAPNLSLGADLSMGRTLTSVPRLKGLHKFCPYQSRLQSLSFLKLPLGTNLPFGNIYDHRVAVWLRDARCTWHFTLWETPRLFVPSKCPSKYKICVQKTGGGQGRKNSLHRLCANVQCGP